MEDCGVAPSGHISATPLGASLFCFGVLFVVFFFFLFLCALGKTEEGWKKLGGANIWAVSWVALRL